MHLKRSRLSLILSKRIGAMAETPKGKDTIKKTEKHITDLPRETNPRLSMALGEMLIAFGRLEDLFKVAIRRLEDERSLEQVITDFGGIDGTIGNWLSIARKFLV
jgi:hypothetical protein